jgi:hypothetical protein
MSCNKSSGPASVIHVVNSARLNVSGWSIAGAAAIASTSLNPMARIRAFSSRIAAHGRSKLSGAKLVNASKSNVTRRAP